MEIFRRQVKHTLKKKGYLNNEQGCQSSFIKENLKQGKRYVRLVAINFLAQNFLADLYVLTVGSD